MVSNQVLRRIKNLTYATFIFGAGVPQGIQI